MSDIQYEPVFPGLPDLHDATLRTVNFEWGSGTAHLRLKIGVGTFDVAIVEARGVTNLKCPRLFPWGPSSSVNTTALEELAGGQLLTIEMQSGDVLEISCRAVVVKREPN
jgi:hypothetical protein